MGIVVVRQNDEAVLVAGDAAARIDIDGELFAATAPEPDWFGFYDWLRTFDGEVIGIRLQLDDSSVIDADQLERLCSLDTRSTRDELYIFFGPQRDFDAAQSDDTDFGGNVFYVGESGSLAISFNDVVDRRPHKRR